MSMKKAVLEAVVFWGLFALILFLERKYDCGWLWILFLFFFLVYLWIPSFLRVLRDFIEHEKADHKLIEELIERKKREREKFEETMEGYEKNGFIFWRE